MAAYGSLRPSKASEIPSIIHRSNLSSFLDLIGTGNGSGTTILWGQISRSQCCLGTDMATARSPGADLVFRKAEPRDLDLVREVYRDVGTWLHEVKHITNQWAREVPEEEARRWIESGALYVALVGRDAAGVLQLSTSGGTLWSGRDGEALYVHSFAVRRRYAGLTLGKSMLDWAADRARAQGKRFHRVDCVHDKPGLNQYYAGAGFASLGQHPQHPWYALFEKEIGE